jgi:hypothetical protein
MQEIDTLKTIQDMPCVLFHGVHYVPIPSPMLETPCYNLAENLILALRESNGLAYMPYEQRLALIAELVQPVPMDN